MTKRCFLIPMLVLAVILAAGAALASTGALTPKGCIADSTNNPDRCPKTAKGLDCPQSVTVSRDGKSVYAAGSQDNAIVRFARNFTTGALTAKGCIADPAHNPDGCPKTAKGLDRTVFAAVSRDG